MKRILRISTAALFGATMLAAPALAQTVEGDVTVNPSVTKDQFEKGAEANAEIDTGTTAAIDSDFENALNMIGNTGAAAAISNLPADGEVRIVYLDALDDSYKSRIDQAMAQSEAEVQELHAAIDSNAMVKSELEAHSVDTSDVISADAALDGSVIVYVR